MQAEHDDVDTPYVAAVEGSDVDARSNNANVLVEAKLTWLGTLLAVTYTKPVGSIRVCDLDLPIPISAGDERDDLVVAKQPTNANTNADAGIAVLVLPSGEIVPPGCRMSLRLGRAMLRLALVPNDVDRIPRARSDRRVATGVLLGAVIHAAVLVCAIFGRAPIGDQEADAGGRAAMTAYLVAIDERSAREAAAAAAAEALAVAGGGSIDTGKNKKDEDAASLAKKREEGAAGNPMRVTEGGMAMRAIGSSRHGQSEREQAETFGMIALLGGDTKVNGSKTARSAFADYDGPGAMGSIFGTTPEDAPGFGGLGLSGTGEGGGGTGSGIPLSGLGTSAFGVGGSCDAACQDRLGLGKIGTIGQGFGFGHGRCGLHCNGHEAHSARWAMIGGGNVMVNGRLPPEAIQRIIRQNHGRLRGCYEAGLQRNPSLEGRVAVKFVIDREGAVSMVSVADSSLGDSQVEACVARAYQTMSFPKPEGGIVTVVYPVVFNNDN